MKVPSFNLYIVHTKRISLIRLTNECSVFYVLDIYNVFDKLGVWKNEHVPT